MYCRRCGAPLHQGVVICPECGARQRNSLSSVRCARCHGRVPLGLSVCPHCGRDVRSAGPRWGLWLAGLLVAVVVVLWGLGELPVERIRADIDEARERIAGVVRVLGPVGQTETPPAGLGPPSTPTAASLVAQASGLASASTPTSASTQAPAATPMLLRQPTETPDESQAPTATPEATATPTATETAEPTQAPTATPEPTATPTAAPPIATPAAVAGTTYTVRSGDSLSSIATRYGLLWQDLAAANGLTGASRLNVGMVLVIPTQGGAAPPVSATAAPPKPTAMPTEAPTPIVLLPAPQLLNPADQTPYSGVNADIELKWTPVDGLPLGALYQVTIRWAEGGAPMEYSEVRTTATSIRMPAWLFGKADQQPTRQYMWSVRVVQVATDGQGGQKDILLSPSSSSRTLYWN